MGDIKGFVDSGATINAVRSSIAQKFAKYLGRDHRAFKAATAKGTLEIREFLKLRVTTKNTGTPVVMRFYLIDDMPYECLLSRFAVRALGYKLLLEDDPATTGNYKHKPNTDTLHMPDSEDFEARLDYMGDTPTITFLSVATKPDILRRREIYTDPEAVLCPVEVPEKYRACPLKDVDVGRITDPKVKGQFWKLLEDFQKLAAKDSFDVGQLTGEEYSMRINLQPGTKPIVSRPLPLSKTMQQEVKRQVRELEERGLIYKSTSSFAAPVLCVKKANGDIRMCMEELNNL